MTDAQVARLIAVGEAFDALMLGGPAPLAAEVCFSVALGFRQRQDFENWIGWMERGVRRWRDG